MGQRRADRQQAAGGLAISPALGALQERAAAITTDPAFAMAARDHGHRALALQRAFPVSSAMLDDAGSFAAAALIYGLGGHATHAVIADRLEETGLASRNRVRATIARLVATGAVVQAADPLDRRRWRIAPTGWLPDFFQAWLDSLLIPIAPFTAPPARAFRSEPMAPLRFLAAADQLLPPDEHLLVGQDSMLVLLSHRGGHLLAMHLLAEAEASGEQRLSRSALARASGHSRAHFANLLRWAEGEGLLRRAPNRAALTVQPAMVALLHQFIAMQFAWGATLAEQASGVATAQP